MSQCGGCNYEIPLDHASLNRVEADGTLTSYHFQCGGVDKSCEDYGRHRRLCNECREEGNEQ
jgi:hypothetical protein